MDNFNQSTGFIKLSRELLSWEWMDNPNTLSLFIYCLLKANYTKKKWRGIEIERGSFITSYAKICKDTGLTTRQARTSLNRLISTNEVTKQTTSQYTCLKIENYDKYTSESTSESTGERQASDKQTTTTKNNNKKNKYIKKNIIKKNPNIKNQAKKILETFNSVMGTRYRSVKPLLGNIKYWLETYSVDDICEAIEVIPRHHFWKDKITPTILLRQRDRSNNNIDYIGDLLNYEERSSDGSDGVPEFVKDYNIDF